MKIEFAKSILESTYIIKKDDKAVGKIYKEYGKKGWIISFDNIPRFGKPIKWETLKEAKQIATEDIETFYNDLI